MPKYTVLVQEVHYTPVEIEAESPHEAIGLVDQEEGKWLHDRTEYSHQGETGDWMIGVQNEKGFTAFTLVSRLED